MGRLRQQHVVIQKFAVGAPNSISSTKMMKKWKRYKNMAIN